MVPRVHPNLTCRGAGCISSRLPSPAVAEGHVPAPSHGLHNGSTQPARVRRGSTGLKVEDNSQVCANSLEFYIEANIIRAYECNSGQNLCKFVLWFLRIN